MRRILTAAAFLLAALPAYAATPYTQSAFEASEHAGKPILVQITASWCPTCAKQRPILGDLEGRPEFKNLVVYNVDFDTQKDIVRQMGAQMQSTLVVFHGTAEKGRSTGDTNAESIKTLLEKANS